MFIYIYLIILNHFGDIYIVWENMGNKMDTLPYFPIFSHIFPYFPIFSHIFPYFPIFSHMIWQYIPNFQPFGFCFSPSPGDEPPLLVCWSSESSPAYLHTWIPSGKHTKNYGQSPFLLGKSTISMAIFNSKLLVYQRVISLEWFGGLVRQNHRHKHMKFAIEAPSKTYWKK